MIEDVKRAIKTFIETQVVSLSGKVYATFPETSQSLPCCVVDVVTSKSNPLMEGGLQTGLVRITLVASKTRELDQIFDDVYEAFIKYGYSINDFSYAGIHGISPLMPAAMEKDEGYKRDMDISVAWIVVR